jgi:hypothetical protein
MADMKNNKVKMAELQQPDTVSSSITIKETPRRLTLLEDGLIAVTTCDKVMYLLAVDDAVSVVSRITTDIEYCGVAGDTDGSLLVSCGRLDNKGVARIDVITRNGKCVRTLTDSKRIRQMEEPWYLCAADNLLFVSDERARAVFKVDNNTGQLVETFSHADLKFPYQVTVDASGNMLVASAGGECVLVRSPGGQWRKLVTTAQLSDSGVDKPWGVCVTNTGRLIVAWRVFGMVAYDMLKQ